MKEQLKEILKEAVIEREEIANLQDIKLLQYKFSNKETIYFNANLLTDDQINLLNIFLTPVNYQNQYETNNQKFWKTLVTRNEVRQTELSSPYYRFIHFHISGILQNEIEFEEVIKNLFQNEVTLVWTSTYEGFIVEYSATIEELVYDGNSLVEAIMADFYIKVSFFLGSSFSTFKAANELFSWEKNAFSLGRRALPKNEVYHKELLIPYLLAHEVSDLTKMLLLQTIEILHDDKELLKTVKVFFESNLNTTLAAKKLFMHRNSLQYRIDKFIEKTGIDIKQFPKAAAMYLLICLEETTRKQ